MNGADHPHHIFSIQICVDESMVPYFGCEDETKKFIREKHAKCGFKLWRDGTGAGFLFRLKPYENQYMLQIDRADQNISLHKIGITGKKW